MSDSPTTASAIHFNMAGADLTLFDEDHILYIPLGTMVPAGLHNFVAAGRCIDAPPAALSGLQVMGPCAAHLSASGSLHQIDIAALQQAMSDNLTRETTDFCATKIATQTGPEAEEKGENIRIFSF